MRQIVMKFVIDEESTEIGAVNVETAFDAMYNSMLDLCEGPMKKLNVVVASIAAGTMDAETPPLLQKIRIHNGNTCTWFEYKV